MRILIISCVLLLCACVEQPRAPLTLDEQRALALQQQQDAIRSQNLTNSFMLWSNYQQQQANNFNASVRQPQSFNCRSQNINGFGYMNCY